MEETTHFNPSHATLCLQLFLPPGGVVEVRALGTHQGTASGYFSERRRALLAARNLSGRAEGVYITLNPVNPDLLNRAANRVIPYARVTTGDDEIDRRRWLPIDVDPRRPRGISSTDDEHRAAQAKASEIRAWLATRGWPEPVLASSGNGAHLLYPIATPNTPEARETLRAVLTFLASKFTDEQCIVDPALFNAARIIRLYGTRAKKGDPSPARPHRVSRFLAVPPIYLAESGNWPCLTLDTFDAFLERARAEEPTHAAGAFREGQRPASAPAPPRNRRSGLDMSALDVVAWFTAHDCYGQCLSDERGVHAVRCPWEEEHSTAADATDTDTVIWDGRDGRLPGFRCLHAHCTARRLREVALLWQDATQFGARERRAGEYEMTDDGNANRLVDRYGDNLRHVDEMGGWWWWNGEHWVRGKAEVFAQATETVLAIQDEIEQLGDGDTRTKLRQHRLKSQSWDRISAMVKASAHKRDTQAKADQFDANPWLVNFAGSTLDLRTGEVRSPAAEDYCTHLIPAAYEPDAKCPRFVRFLHEVFCGDEALVDYVLDLLGYSLTGSVREQIVPILHGSGSNGKSTLIQVVLRVFGSYATTAAPNLLLESKSDRHPTEVADLRGRRFVACQETGDGRRLAEDTVKRLTGGDRLKARFMRGDFFEFDPTHKLWLACNHKPVIRGTDHAIWRRVPLIPFAARFVDQADLDRMKAEAMVNGTEMPAHVYPRDPALLDVLYNEVPGILALIVRHARKWMEHGLTMPRAVQSATANYRATEDVLGAFLEECCVEEPGAETPAADLYLAYRAWCEAAGEYCHSQKRFGQALSERGFDRRKVSTYRWIGLRLLDEAERATAGECL